MQTFSDSKSDVKSILYSIEIDNKKNYAENINMIGENLLEEIFVNLFGNSVKYSFIQGNNRGIN